MHNIIKITVHGEFNIISRVTKTNFPKSLFVATMEITIHEEN